MLFGMLCCGNEADRHLDAVLHHLDWLVDHCAVFDDQTTDGTVDIARAHRCTVRVRPDHIPSFNENEGLFRQAGWEWMVRSLQPSVDDWVLAVDADEFVTYQHVLSPSTDLAGVTRRTIEAFCDLNPFNTGLFKVTECFGWDNEGALLERTDGFWGQITAERLTRFEPGHEFRPVARGGGSLPMSGRRAKPVRDVTVLHLGYCTDSDRQFKHARYSSHAGQHSNKHIDSIIKNPVLSRWSGKAPAHERRD